VVVDAALLEVLLVQVLLRYVVVGYGMDVFVGVRGHESG